MALSLTLLFVRFKAVSLWLRKFRLLKMVKDKTVDHASSDQDMSQSPYACCLKALNCKTYDGPSPYIGDKNEWEEARCPVCLEHPHNAVLLLCSSKDKGCRPFMCDTSYRHSNCFDQFKKSFAQASDLQTELKPELICPLCRGLITGWVVVEPARKYMDSKIRSCSLETCNFSGNYARLRKHARTEHPSKRPSEVSPTRQSSWLDMEQQRELEDAYTYHSDFGIDSDGFPDPDVFPDFDPDWEWLDFENWHDFFEGSFDVVDDFLSPSSSSFRTTSSLDTFDWSSSSGSEMFIRTSPLNDRRRDDGIQSSRSRRNYHDRASPSRPRSSINRDREGSRFGNQRESSSRNRRRSNPTHPWPRSDYYRDNHATSSRPTQHREESRRRNSRSSYHRDNARSSTRSRIRPRSRSRERENASSSRVVSSSRSREVARERSRRRRSRERSSSRYNTR